MAKGYGFETSDWLLFGLVGAVLFYTYKTIQKPLDMLSSGAGQVYSDVKDVGKGIITGAGNIADFGLNIPKNIVNTASDVVDNAINYKETVTNPDKSTTTYKGNYAQVKAGKLWDFLTGNNGLSSSNQQSSLYKTPTGTYGTALDLGGYLTSSNKPTNYFSNLSGKVYGQSNALPSNTNSNTNISNSNITTSVSRQTNAKKITEKDYTNGRLNAGTYQTTKGIVKVSKAYRKK